MRSQSVRSAPIGKLSRDFVGLYEAGCIQAADPKMIVLFYALHKHTDGNPCNGCPEWQSLGPACPAFQKYHSAASDKAASELPDQVPEHLEPATKPGLRNGKAWAGMSVSEIATKLNISKSEVRRLKQAGKLEALAQ